MQAAISRMFVSIMKIQAIGCLVSKKSWMDDIAVTVFFSFSLFSSHLGRIYDRDVSSGEQNRTTGIALLSDNWRLPPSGEKNFLRRR